MKILFTSTLTTSFIKEDLTILRRHFEVHSLIGHGISSILRILFHIPRIDLTYTWFASVYSSFAVLGARVFGKRSIIVVGGVDAARIPEIGYGIWLVPWKAVLVKWALRNASHVLAVAPSLKLEAARLAGYDGANIAVVPTGYDSALWSNPVPKEGFVLTVAACDNPERLKVKGIDLLIAAARVLPNVKFVVIGIGRGIVEHARSVASPNVEILPFVERNELLGYYQRAKVYCQPSYAEGFPNSLCEAMLCGCVPVGTDVGGIPMAIDNTGYIVPYGDPRRLADAVLQALHSPERAGERARERIAAEFTLARRETELLRIIGGV